MTFDRLHHMQLAMPPGGEQSARTFFVGILGMVEVDKPPVLAPRGGAWFRAGGVELHLGIEDDFRPARKGQPGIVVTDLADVVQRLSEAGQVVRWDADFPGFSVSTPMTHSATVSNSSSRHLTSRAGYGTD